MSCSAALSFAVSDLHSYYKCDEANGATELVDVIAAENLLGTVQSDPGKIATAVRIGMPTPPGAAKAYQSAAATSHWDLSDSSWTIRFWATFTAYAGYFVVLEIGDIQIYYDTSQIQLYVDAGGTVDVSKNISNGAWHRIIAWHEKGVGIGLKIDNDAAGTSATVGSLVSANRTLYVGASEVSGSHSIDEIGVWKRKLSDAEMLADWNGGNGVTYP